MFDQSNCSATTTVLVASVGIEPTCEVCDTPDQPLIQPAMCFVCASFRSARELVLQGGIDPPSHGYQPSALPLSYWRVLVVTGGFDPPFPACHAGVLPLNYATSVGGYGNCRGSDLRDFKPALLPSELRIRCWCMGAVSIHSPKEGLYRPPAEAIGFPHALCLVADLLIVRRKRKRPAGFSPGGPSNAGERVGLGLSRP